MDCTNLARRIALSTTLLFLVACQGPRSTEDSIKLGDHYLEFGEWQKAADTFAPVIERSPGTWKAEYGFGVANANLGDLKVARRCLETANDRSPNNIEVISALAGVMSKQGDTKQMYQLLLGAGASMGSAQPYLVLAQYAQSLNDSDSAVTALRSAIEVDNGVITPRSAMPYVEMAALQHKLGNQLEAIRRLRQAYGIAPKDPRILQALAQAGVPVDAQTALPPGL